MTKGKEKFKYTYDELFDPTLEALHNLGGSGSVDEIEEQVASILKLTDEQVSEIHRGGTSKLTYRLAWARNYLKRYGLLENSSRGVWALSEQGQKTKQVDKQIVKRHVKGIGKKQGDVIEVTDAINISDWEGSDPDRIYDVFSWRNDLISRIQDLSPAAFERLCQRLLRELGFLNVEVTGRVNDGGIDGKGLLRVGGVLSFHVIFQAKKYKGSISPSTVRDFRGAMIGRADKGLIITTGTFTREAKKEASRDGAPPIDLMDGSDLAYKLKELGLGVEVELVEKITIKSDWFKSI